MVTWESKIRTGYPGEFLGGPVVGFQASTAGGMRLIPGQGTKMLHATWYGPQKKKPNKQTKKLALLINCIY